MKKRITEYLAYIDALLEKEDEFQWIIDYRGTGVCTSGVVDSICHALLPVRKQCAENVRTI